MAKNLLIVESPAKAKTIEKYLGKDFTVKSSFGHIRDLIKNSKDKKAIEVDNNYKVHYEISPAKRKVVSELKSWVKKVDEVWLATDEDREGEAISWHLAKVLNLDVHKTKRIVFREITKPALQKAITAPRLIDLDLVNAQQARRVLDRLVGFELSELLWKKIRGKLSAGRVQSVAVRLVVEKERAIEEFTPEAFFAGTASFLVPNERGGTSKLQAKLYSRESKSKELHIDTVEEAQAFLKDCIGAEFTIEDIEVKDSIRKPPVPFTTSTLQQDASHKLYFSVAKTMQVAQRLYEAGHITYMRTDSTNLSQTAMQALEAEIKSSFGPKYYQARSFNNKKGAQEAHEAIRPTNVEKKVVSNNRDEQRLYDLIRKRTLASQMADALLEKTTVTINISSRPDEIFLAKGEVIKFEGFLALYLVHKEEEEEEDDSNSDLLPPMKPGQKLKNENIDATERFSRGPSRYAEASLVKELEKRGIGRPSTYAPTITKIMDPSRGYVTKETREGQERNYRKLSLVQEAAEIKAEELSEKYGTEKNKLFASDLGKQVTDFLMEHFGDIMDYNFTADVEDRLDKVAEGQEQWQKMLDLIYKPFHKLVEQTAEDADRVTGERILGKDPKTGHTLLVRIGRYGPLAQIGAPDELGEEEKPQYANLKREQSIETITFEEALELFKLPRNIGSYKGQELEVNSGRYGPYVKFDGKFISLPKGADPISFTYEEAVPLVEARIKEDAPIGHFKDLPITKGAGRFGPFVKWNKLFVSITKGSGFQLETITEAQAIELIEAKLEKEANRYIQKWPDYALNIENGRWGPFIRSGKKSYKLLNAEGKKLTPEEAKEVTLERAIELVEEQGGKVKKPRAKKTTAKKKTNTKKKTTTKKTK